MTRVPDRALCQRYAGLPRFADDYMVGPRQNVSLTARLLSLGRWLALSPTRELPPQPVQPSAKRPIHHRISNPHDDSAEYRRIDGEVGHDALSECARELLADRRLFPALPLLRERHVRGYARLRL